MKVLHVIPSVSPKYGGPSAAVWAMTQGLVRKGITVDVATTNADGTGVLSIPLNVPIIESGVTYYYFQRHSKLYNFSASLTIWLIRNSAHYDLIHIHGLFAYPTLVAGYSALPKAVPYIVRPFGTLNRWGMQNRRASLKKLWLRFIEGPLLDRAAAIQYTCEQERIEAEEAGVAGHSVILPIGIDLAPYQQLPSGKNFYSRYPDLKEQRLLLFLSRFHPKKGLDLLLPAFAQVQKEIPNSVLLMAGDGDANYVAQLKKQAYGLGIVNKIIWTGFLEGREKLEAMNAADIFVLPSYSENFGIAAVEAMAAGLPVVVSDQVGIHHEIHRANAGKIITCGINELASVLTEMLNDPQSRLCMSQHAKQLVRNLFSTDTMASRLVELYQATARRN